MKLQCQILLYASSLSDTTPFLVSINFSFGCNNRSSTADVIHILDPDDTVFQFQELLDIGELVICPSITNRHFDFTDVYFDCFVEQ
jgi:hypothetical protein